MKVRGRKDSKVSKNCALNCYDFNLRSSKLLQITLYLLIFFPFSWYDVAGVGGSAFLRCASTHQSPEENRAAEGGSTSSGPRQDVLHTTERWMCVALSFKQSRDAWM